MPFMLWWTSMNSGMPAPLAVAPLYASRASLATRRRGDFRALPIDRGEDRPPQGCSSASCRDRRFSFAVRSAPQGDAIQKQSIDGPSQVDGVEDDRQLREDAPEPVQGLTPSPDSDDQPR